MKKQILLICIFCAVLCAETAAQGFYTPSIDYLKLLVSKQLITKYDRELSGDTTAIVGGNTYRILSRRTNSPYNPVAAQYIYEKFVSFGLSARYQVNSPTCVNVIATKTGTKYPNKQFLIFAHYDDYSRNSVDTIPGADDNASGVCGVLEAARVFSAFDSYYTVKFIAFDEEEDWMIGSYAYADSAYANGDSIMGFINLDMIGFDPLNQNKYKLNTNNASVILASSYSNFSSIYQIPLVPFENVNDNNASDNLPFWEKGYKGLFIIESNFNTYYHTISETAGKLNFDFMTNNIKAAIVTLASWCTDRLISIRHTPPNSSTDTSARTLVFQIKSSVALGTGSSRPRLNYKTNAGNYKVLYPEYASRETLIFKIPGQTGGTKVYYYFALQDSVGLKCVTYPPGGYGVNPPGIIPPQSLCYYEIYTTTDKCSSTLPRIIKDKTMTLDSINISQPGYVTKATVNLTIYHQNDGDLILQLLKEGCPTVILSNLNGEGGMNYFYTTFDDSAGTAITQASPPFTGVFRPQGQLSSFINAPIAGSWVLRVTDTRTNNQGTLSNWCINLLVKTSVGVDGKENPVEFILSQNYPNPFNSATRISYSIPKNSNVNLKIYDMLGREVRTLASGFQNAGDYIVMFNSGDLSSGVYFYRLTAGDYSDVKRMVIIK